MRFHLLSTLPLCSVLAGSLALAQVPAGGTISVVRVGPTSTATSQMYVTNPSTGKATQLAISTTMAGEILNTILMVNPALGYVTTGTAAPANIYRILVTGTKATETKLNTAALPGQNASQIVILGTTLYTTCQKGTASGVIVSMPLAGGAPTTIYDFSADTSWPSGHLSNCLATDGKKLYVGSWPFGASAATNSVVLAYDLATKKAAKLLDMPLSKYSTNYKFYPVNLQMDKTAANVLVATTYVGDVAFIDTTTGKVLRHLYAGMTSRSYNFTNSFIQRVDHDDWVVGTRDGALDVFIPYGTGHTAQRHWDKIGTHPTPTRNSVAGVWYQDTALHYKAYGDGCPGTSGFTPTSVDYGLPQKGNPTFAFGLESGLGGAVAVMFIGTSRTHLGSAPILPLKLDALGAPGCNLRQNLVLPLPTLLSSTGPGVGKAKIPIPLPNITGTLFTQWMVLDKVNTLGLIFSDGRELKL